MTRDEITDETLMAYADGALDAAARARVEDALVGDAALAARLKVFTATREALGALGRNDRATIDVPPGLQAALRAKIEGGQTSGETAAPASATAADRVVTFKPRPARSMPLWSGALAASLALAVGLVGGLLLGSGSGSGSGGAGMPQGAALNAALDTVSSGDGLSLADGTTVTVIATFLSAEGAICREYEVERPAGLQSVEVACDGGAGWEPQLMLALGGAEGYAPASAPELLELYFEQSNAGAPLDPEAERAALEARGD